MNLFQIAPLEYYIQVILLSISIVMMGKCLWNRKWEQFGVWFVMFGFTLIGLSSIRVLDVAESVPTIFHY